MTNNADATVTRIDPSTAQVVGEPIAVGQRAARRDRGRGLRVGRQLRRRHREPPGPADRPARSATPIKVGRDPRELTVGLGFVWVANNDDNSVTRIDPRTGKVVGTAIPVGKDPLGIAAGSDSVWVVNHGDDTVTRIEP